jgi:hypothetical protein
LAGEIGITTWCIQPHLCIEPEPGKFTLLEFPRIMRNELDMRVIDLNTKTLASLEPEYCDRVRAAAEKQGCLLTNLKMNYSDLDMSSLNASVREKAISQYKRAIDAAQRLGCRWARPLPLKAVADMNQYVASFRELADYAQERGVQMVVENYGWMDSDSDSVPRLIKAVGRNIAASPDTANWANDELRFTGLAKAFPLAVTCDFKAAGEMGPRGEHPLYDLRRCFQVGWDAGFRGPWCLEHGHADRTRLFRELGMLRDMLREWMASSG